MTTENLNCWHDLANAIIQQAAQDYRHTRKLLKNMPPPKEGEENTRYQRLMIELKDIERFFDSDYFNTLTHADGRAILAELKKEAV